MQPWPQRDAFRRLAAWIVCAGVVSALPSAGCGRGVSERCLPALAEDDASAGKSLLQVAQAAKQVPPVPPVPVLDTSTGLPTPLPVGRGGRPVSCGVMSMPDLNNGTLVCSPIGTGGGERWPLLVFGHGDWQPAELYANIIVDAASFGFVVAAYRSCIWVLDGDPDSDCEGGMSTFLEALKVIDFFAKNASADTGLAPVDMAQGVTVAGHSGGGKVALMTAAIRDSPTYLRGTTYAERLDADSGALRNAAKRVHAAIGLHADDMRDPVCNPDVEGFVDAITATPVLLDTSADDLTVPESATWWNFLNLRSPSKIYIDMAPGLVGLTDGHMQPEERGLEGPWVAVFAQAFAAGNATARRLLYGDGEGSLRNFFPDFQTRERTPSLLLCGGTEGGRSVAWPPDSAALCEARPSA